MFQDNYGEDLAEELRKTNRFVPDKEFSGTDRSTGASRSGTSGPRARFGELSFFDFLLLGLTHCLAFRFSTRVKLF